MAEKKKKQKKKKCIWCGKKFKVLKRHKCKKKPSWWK